MHHQPSPPGTTEPNDQLVLHDDVHTAIAREIPSDAELTSWLEGAEPARDATGNPRDSQGQMVAKAFVTLCENTSYIRKELSKDPNQWAIDLPCVSIKSPYIVEPEIPHRGDRDHNGRLVRRAVWPSHFTDLDEKKLSKFKEYLSTEKRGVTGTKDVHVRNMRRFLGALDVEDDVPVTDPAVLVSFVTSDLLPILMRTQAWASKLYWTDGLITALDYYIDHMKDEIGKMEPLNQDVKWDKYNNQLNRLKDKIRHNWRGLVEDWKIVKCHQRAKWDRDAYAKFPKIKDIQAGVKRAYCIIKAAFDKYKDAASMPPNVWSQVNEAIVFAITYDTFCGRRGEWEKMLLRNMLLVLQATQTLKDGRVVPQDWIQCDEHKTYKTYGDISKWLSPGLLEAFKLYVQLPRKDGDIRYPYLLFNHHSATTHKVTFSKRDPWLTVRLPLLLRRFSRRIITESETTCIPNHTLVRKWIHTFLMSMVQDQTKLKDIMEIIDAHGHGVQDKHYHIKFPQDDSQLAQKVHTAAFGGQVPFPSEADMDAFLKEQEANGWSLEEDDLENVPNEGEELDEDSNSDWLHDWEKVPSMGTEWLDHVFLIPKSHAVPVIPLEEVKNPEFELNPDLVDFKERIDAISKRNPVPEYKPSKWLLQLKPADKTTRFTGTQTMWTAIMDCTYPALQDLSIDFKVPQVVESVHRLRLTDGSSDPSQSSALTDAGEPAHKHQRTSAAASDAAAAASGDQLTNFERMQAKQQTYALGYDLAEIRSEALNLTPEQQAQIIEANTIEQDVAIIQSLPADGEGTKRAKKLRRDIHPAKLVLYEKYKPPDYKMVKEGNLDPKATEFLKKTFEDWHAKYEHIVGPDDVPYGHEYYLDLRIICIMRKEGITSRHSEKVCKSNMEAIITMRQRAADKLADATKKAQKSADNVD